MQTAQFPLFRNMGLKDRGEKKCNKIPFHLKSDKSHFEISENCVFVVHETFQCFGHVMHACLSEENPQRAAE